MRPRLTLALALVWSACGRVDFDRLGDHDASSGDGTSGDALASCAGDDFSDGIPCMPWGIATTAGATITEASGELVITPLPNMTNAEGDCRSAQLVPFTTAGIVVEVTSTLASGQTGVGVDDGLVPSSMFVNMGMISVDADSSTAGMAVFDPPAMRWWRIRQGGSVVLYETSPDRSQWTTIAAAGITVGPNVTVQLGAIQSQATASPGSARFGSVSACP